MTVTDGRIDAAMRILASTGEVFAKATGKHPVRLPTLVLISNLVLAAREAGFERGRMRDDATANIAEDAALDALLAHLLDHGQ